MTTIKSKLWQEHVTSVTENFHVVEYLWNLPFSEITNANFPDFFNYGSIDRTNEIVKQIICHFLKYNVDVILTYDNMITQRISNVFELKDLSKFVNLKQVCIVDLQGQFRNEKEESKRYGDAFTIAFDTLTDLEKSKQDYRPNLDVRCFRIMDIEMESFIKASEVEEISDLIIDSLQK
ncbi:gp200 [Sphingomonas phage PAU]|uniref:gp200 n=1 Tax=Sphingomonas phage PAU TaxID=1150991 RepID=UPI0002573366|nr:gp200 [Sphingomonas phage PAU]AFF28198.1 gp200 [Sphingomonas phage PAU]